MGRPGLAYAKRNIRQYASSIEQWKRDHLDAMKCRELEDFIRIGLSLFEFINDLDEDWRSQVRNGHVPYSKEADDTIAALYEGWLTPCPRVAKEIERFEKKGFDVEGKEEFNSACCEVQGIVTPDSDFFVGKPLTRLREEAEKTHREGRTKPM